MCAYHWFHLPEHGEEQREERNTVHHQEGLEEQEETLVEAYEALQGGHTRTCRETESQSLLDMLLLSTNLRSGHTACYYSGLPLIRPPLGPVKVS